MVKLIFNCLNVALRLALRMFQTDFENLDTWYTIQNLFLIHEYDSIYFMEVCFVHRYIGGTERVFDRFENSGMFLIYLRVWGFQYLPEVMSLVQKHVHIVNFGCLYNTILLYFWTMCILMR